MSKSLGRVILTFFVWLFSLRYYWECLYLDKGAEKLTVSIAFWVLTALALAELGSLVRKIFQDKNRWVFLNESFISKIMTDKRTWLIIAVILYIIFIPIVGFYLTSFISFCIFSIILGSRNPVKIILSGIIVLAFIYGIFTSLLQISLPTGILL